MRVLIDCVEAWIAAVRASMWMQGCEYLLGLETAMQAPMEHHVLRLCGQSVGW